MNLDALERALRTNLTGTTLALDPLLLAEMGLPPLPSFLVASQPFVLGDAAISSEAAGRLVVRGGFVHAPLGSVALEIVVSAHLDGVEAVALWNLSAVDLGHLARAAGLPIPELLDTLQVSAIELGEVLELKAHGEVELGIGPIRAALVAERLVLALSPLKVLEVEAALVLGGRGLPVVVSGDQLSFDASAWSVRELIEAFRIPLPPLPPLPLLGTRLAQFRLFPLDGDHRASGRFDVANLGPVRFAIGTRGDSLAVALALEAGEDSSLGQLHEALAPFDALTNLIALDTPALTVATADLEAWPIPDGDGGWTRIDVPKGLHVYGELVLSGFGLEMLNVLTGLDRLPFKIPLGGDMSQIRLVAELEQQLPVLPGVLTIQRVVVTLAPQPLTITAAGDASLTLFGMALPPLRFEATLGAGTYGLILAARAPWERPLGLPFTIDGVGIQVDGPVVAYGFFGRMTLQDRPFAVAAKFTAQAPTFLEARLNGDFSFVALVAELTGLKLPLLFEPKLTDPAFYVVIDPRGAEIGGRLYPRGIGLAGSLSFFGLAARIRLHADGVRLQAEGALEAPIRMAPLLEVSGPDGAGPPALVIDTGADPVMRLRGRLMMLGLSQEISARVGTQAVAFEIQQSAGPVRADLRAELAAGKFAAEGTTSCRIAGSIGPIRVGGRGPSLGTIRLDAGVSCDTRITASGTGDARINVRASFKFGGLTIRLPAIDLQLDSLTKLPEALFGFVRDNALRSFAELFNSVDKWLTAVAHKLIGEVEDAAKVLRDHFKKSIEDVARALRTTLAHGIKETVRALERAGETTERAAQALVAIAESPEDVARALKELKRGPDEIGKILRALNRPEKEIRRIFKAVGLPPDVAETVVRRLFPLPIPDKLPVRIPGSLVPRIRVPRIRVRF